MAESKPSFLKSAYEGAKGYVKGVIAGGIVGIIAGGIVGAIVGIVWPGVLVASAAGIGATIAGSVLATLGAISGTVTGVVKSREPQVHQQDVVNIANISFAQGVAVGQQMSQQKALEQVHEEVASSQWRDREVERRRAAALAAPQIH